VIGTQTPYAVRRELLLRAYEAARAENKQETSTMTLLTRTGIPVRLVAGESANWKITYTADWEQACALLADDS
jgi:2-C-methyl-D-erythritol 4-phosphate cytidylyltransferase